MLDPNFIRDNVELVTTVCKNKNKSATLVAEFLDADSARKAAISTIEALRQQVNEGSKKVASASSEERGAIIADLTAVKNKIKDAEDSLLPIEDVWESLLKQIPNVTSPAMPVGKHEDENVVVKEWGTKRDFAFEIKDHVALGKQLGIIDVEKSGVISGSRFYYLKGDAVLLQFAIIQHTLATLGTTERIAEVAKNAGLTISAKAFVPMLPPVIMRQEVMAKMDRLEPKEQRYLLPEDEQVFVGSAEHTMGSYHMDEVLEEAKLPVRYIGYSTAFRREAGTYGKDMGGILRVHQFDKLEMESFTTAETGADEQRLIVALQEHLVQSLGLPYRVIHVCTGDTGKPDYDQYDIECWIPSQNRYRETHTSDYMTDYQARRLKTYYKTAHGERAFAHMNDATAFAISRILIAILENNQQADGSVSIPEVLRPYMAGKSVISAIV
jgi:seryl-tRNA synthetase